MWAFYVVFFAFLFYFLWQIPPQWRKFRSPLFWLVNGVGFGALIVLITFFWRLPNGWFRQAVLYAETVYFSLLSIALTVGIFRQTAYYPMRHWAGKRVIRIFADRKLFLGIILVSTALYCVLGIRQMEQLSATPYTVTLDKACQEDSMRIALMADLHMGAGSSYAQLERLVEAINENQVDAVVLAGDIVDSSSSQADLDAFLSAVSRMESRFGIYYAEGNHEKECHFDPEPGMEAIGVHILHDSAELLPNGAAILGRCDRQKTAVEDIRQTSGIAADTPCIVIQHRPQGLRRLAESCDLVLCGHTHGYQTPLCALYFPVLFDLVDRAGRFGNMQAITTTGVATWGFHATWPSRNEVAIIDVLFEGGMQNAA